jgi:hypothetical protein
MQPYEQLLYKHLKEQLQVLDKQIALLQELKQQTDQDLLQLETQVKDRQQLSLF